ncbi:hypothetical protein BDN70DRAFT_930869 [Pholiota conissans]|uniref:Uncharacterized protein n=1 Tax=Pholiota conissans TaxID=109636 RepID=A0A9P5Z5S6_9AGAR|nr:hypothetical protein BDN70DRAFT_930869 [Pholiota conissans]
MALTQYTQAPSPQNACTESNSPSPLNIDCSVLHGNDVLKYQTRFQNLPSRFYAIPQTHHSKARATKSGKLTTIAHPYARLFAKKDEVKRRKIWNHALEKSIFDPHELSSMGAPQRRTIYISSLEAHIDRLHAQLLEVGFWPVAFETLAPFKGLNSKTAKSMVAGLQHDASVSKLKLLELERANNDLEKICSETECEDRLRICQL